MIGVSAKECCHCAIELNYIEKRETGSIKVWSRLFRRMTTLLVWFDSDVDTQQSVF